MRFLFIIMLFSSTAYSASDDWYIQTYCTGEKYKKMPDLTICDCVDDVYAYEYSRDWQTAAGKALHMANQSGKRAGIVMMIDTSDNFRNAEMVRTDIQQMKFPIDLWFKGIYNVYYPASAAEKPTMQKVIEFLQILAGLR